MHYLPLADPTSLSKMKALLWFGGFPTVTKPAESFVSGTQVTYVHFIRVSGALEEVH